MTAVCGASFVFFRRRHRTPAKIAQRGPARCPAWLGVLNRADGPRPHVARELPHATQSASSGAMGSLARADRLTQLLLRQLKATARRDRNAPNATPGRCQYQGSPRSVADHGLFRPRRGQVVGSSRLALGRFQSFAMLSLPSGKYSRGLGERPANLGIGMHQGGGRERRVGEWGAARARKPLRPTGMRCSVPKGAPRRPSGRTRSCATTAGLLR